MAETLRVLAKAGVLVTDHRHPGKHRFIGRGHQPPPWPGVDPVQKVGLIDSGTPNEVDELFPIKAEPTDIILETTHKNHLEAHRARELYAYYKARVTEGDLLPADAETAAACGVKLAAPAASAAASDHDHDHAG